MFKLCQGMIDSNEGRIQLRDSDRLYKLISFSYITPTDINMTLERNGSKVLVTRTRQEFKCIGCSRQIL